MRCIVVLLALCLSCSLYAANTETLIFSDIASTSYESDYGVVTVNAGQLPSISKWDEKIGLPLSVSNALIAARSQLPKEGKGEWHLSSIALTSFGEHSGYGEWYYVVCFYHITMFTKDKEPYKTTTRYTSVVHFDGSVLTPIRKNEETTAKRSVEHHPAPYPEPPTVQER